ncbi:MAG: T9SS type A sorting domain-containing protein [Flavobacteriales bacterium]|nr:T9SS type A sorting domain-containing protein [Flavobacteriales bacterium]
MRYLFTSIILFCAVFTSGQSITVSSPSGGDTLIGGQSYTLIWSTTGVIDSVDLYYRRGGLYFIERVVNSGTYQWTVPSDIRSSNYCFFRVKNAVSALYDENNSAFQLLEAQKSITVTFPNAVTDTLFSGQVNQIRWNSLGYIYKVHIYLSRNGGLSYSRISPFNGILNTGVFDYIPINSYQASNALIRVEGYGSLSQYQDVSDTSFNLIIGKAFELLSPLPKNLVVGNTEIIQWTNTGNISFVDLEYSTDWAPWKSIADSIPNSGSYSWTIPLDSGNTVRLRIVEHNNSSVFDQVYGLSMTAQPQLITLLSPNGGESFTEGDSLPISWTRSPNINGLQMELYYSIDSGATWLFITDGLFTNNFLWTAPFNVNSLNCLIRASLNGILGVNDISDATFTLNIGSPSVTIVFPNDAGEYLAGANKSLSYRVTGGLDTLSLFYSIDGGVSYSLLKNDISGNAQWTSVVYPDIQEESVFFKLQSNQMPFIFDVSDSAFAIHKFKLYQPYTNQVFYQGATANITWGKSLTSDSTITLLYSINNALTWDTIATHFPNTGSYSWTVPNVQSSQLKLRIEGVSLTNQFDISGGVASIIPSPITVSSPNGGEYWDSGTSYPITWTTDSGANVNVVRIKYSLNNGQTWTIINNYVTNSGLYNWNTPNIIDSNVLVQVENRSNGGVPSDRSDAAFSIGIVAPTVVTVNSPNGGEDFYMSTTRNILWTGTGNVDTVDIQHSSNGGQTWQSVSTNEINDGIYSWNVPNVNSGNNLIRIYKTGDILVGDTSNAVFSILVRPGINLTSPNGGELYAENQQMPITWDTTAIDSTVIIQFSNDGGNSYNTLITNAPNTGIYLWTIPSGYATVSAKVRIEASVVGLIRSDFSLSNFTISPPLGTITVTSPNGGEMWRFQTSQDITWASTGSVGNVDLSYSIDSGITWVSIKNNEPNDGIESWSSGFGLKANVLVKVEESSQPLVFDVSDSVFQIIDKSHSIYITSPNQSSGQTWTEGDSRTIAWNSTGIFSMVTILVSSDNGLSYTLIADSVFNNPQLSSSYLWVVPHGINSSLCKIKIEEFGNPSVFDVSRQLRISDSRTLTILSPNGGEVFNGLDTIKIRWAETGIIHTIQLAYSLDSGLSWNNHHVVQVSDTNTFIPWVVPNQNLTTVLLRASDGGGAIDVSDSVFSIHSIQKLITLLPIADTVRFWGNHGIDWLSAGVSNFSVMLSLDSGQTWGVAPGVFFNGPNHFNWSGPKYNTTGVMIRVEDRDSSQYFDTSQLLVVEGYSNLEIITPNGGETLYTDSNLLIEWKHFPGSVSSLSHVNLEYSIDTGASWIQITTYISLATDSTYLWTIPNHLHGNSAIIRVEGYGSGNEVNYDISDNFFYIESAAELSLVSPNSLDIVYSDSTVLIDWNSNISVANVNIQYKLNSTNRWTLIDSNVVDTGSYLWNMPVGLHDYAEIRVSVTDSIQINDSVNLLIKPKFNHLNIIFPNGGEVFDGNQYINSIWDWSGVYPFQWELKLSTDSGLTWHTINDGQKFGGVLDSARGLFSNINSSNRLIAITSFPYGDTLDAVFTINYNATTINITSPNGGESFLGNTTTKLSWDTLTNSHIDSVFIGMANSTGGIIGSLKKVTNSGASPFEIPNLSSTTNAKAFIRLDDYSISDYSDTAFSISITSNDTLLVVSPNGGEQLLSGQQIPIIWQASNTIALIDIEFSVDSGTTWTNIVNNTPNCGFYLWSIPTSVSSSCKIRVSGNTKAFLQDESDAVFGVQLSTSIKELESVTKVQFYPNPIRVGQELSIAGIVGSSKVELLSMEGKLIEKYKIESGRILLSNTVNSGTYILRITTINALYHEKLVIE